MDDKNPYTAPSPESRKVPTSPPARQRGQRAAGLWTLVAIQWCLFFVIVFGDIGFDHPGRFGLSFHHFILFCAAYVGLFGVGIVLAGVRNRSGLVAVMFISAVIHVGIVMRF
jgi:hypothetical protein